MKENLLYISSHLPSYRVPQAGHKTARMILEEYAAGYDIYFYCFLNSEESRYFREEEFLFCKSACFIKIGQLARIISILRRPFLPINTAMRASSKIIREIKAVQEKISFGKAHFEFTACAYYINFIGREIKKIVSEHDLTYQAYERKGRLSVGLKKLIYGFEYKRQKKWELEILHKADEILVHNFKDRDMLIADKITRDRIRLIEPYINPLFKKAKRDKIEPLTLLFWGAMNRPENIDAVEWFAGEIFPGVVGRYPGVKLYIVGANPPDSIKKLENPNITVTGFVENPLHYFEMARLAVAPLRLGAGVKVKVLEALSAGIPVIATTVGAEGISNENLFVADSSGKFLELILEKIK
jgi:glycosyltransferase involved in cell wall biosynthesis